LAFRSSTFWAFLLHSLGFDGLGLEDFGFEVFGFEVFGFDTFGSTLIFEVFFRILVDVFERAGLSRTGGGMMVSTGWSSGRKVLHWTKKWSKNVLLFKFSIVTLVCFYQTRYLGSTYAQNGNYK
jgi:hypothetical protein